MKQFMIKNLIGVDMNLDELQEYIDEKCCIIYIICDARIKHEYVKKLIIRGKIKKDGFYWTDKNYINILNNISAENFKHTIGLCTSHLDFENVELYTFNKYTKTYDTHTKSVNVKSDMVSDITVMNDIEFANYKIMEII